MADRELKHVLLAVTILLAVSTGCAASRGEGLTVGNGLINTGASQEMREMRLLSDRGEIEEVLAALPKSQEIIDVGKR